MIDFKILLKVSPFVHLTLIQDNVRDLGKIMSAADLIPETHTKSLQGTNLGIRETQKFSKACVTILFGGRGGKHSVDTSGCVVVLLVAMGEGVGVVAPVSGVLPGGRVEQVVITIML